MQPQSGCIVAVELLPAELINTDLWYSCPEALVGIRGVNEGGRKKGERERERELWNVEERPELIKEKNR